VSGLVREWAAAFALLITSVLQPSFVYHCHYADYFFDLLSVMQPFLLIISVTHFSLFRWQFPCRSHDNVYYCVEGAAFIFLVSSVMQL
jgi:hypothetical protein